jgi:hypothetical protein
MLFRPGSIRHAQYFEFELSMPVSEGETIYSRSIYIIFGVFRELALSSVTPRKKLCVRKSPNQKSSRTKGDTIASALCGGTLMNGKGLESGGQQYCQKRPWKGIFHPFLQITGSHHSVGHDSWRLPNLPGKA